MGVYMKKLALIVVLYALILSPVQAAPAMDQWGCLLFTNMAVVARALAVEKVDKDKAAKIILLIYNLQGDADALSMVGAVLRAAYTDVRDPGSFAREFYAACMTEETDGFLGVSA